MTNLLFGTIREARRALAGRAVSADELTRAHLAAIQHAQPYLNAFTFVDEAGALAQAAEADRALAAGDTRPLLGIPISLKDLVDQQGAINTGGGNLPDRRPSETDATVTRKLREAGAIFLGRTNLHEFAMGTTSENPHFGPVHNPWDLSRVPGGSSGGSGAAVAAGLSYMALGSDTGGSIRIPAALCGVTGFKPTYGRVSRRGVLPLSWTADHLGPLARSVEDCAIVLNVIAGYDPEDPGSVNVPAPDYTEGLGQSIAGLRVGYVESLPTRHVEPDVQARVAEAVAVLQRLGAEIVPLELNQLGDGVATTAMLFRVEASQVHRKSLLQWPEAYGPDVRARLRAGQLMPASAYLNALRVRRLLVKELDALFEAVDVMVLPVTPIVAPKIGETQIPVVEGGPDSRVLLSSFTSLFNATGVPAISVPCGLDSQGLPVGLHIAGQRWNDALVLKVAAAYQTVMPPANPPALPA